MGITSRKSFRYEPWEEQRQLLFFFCFQLFFLIASLVFHATSLLVSSCHLKSILPSPVVYLPAGITLHSMPNGY